MSDIKNIKSSIEFKPDEYVNINTGETLSSELNNSKCNIKLTEVSDKVTISSDEYMIIDANAWEYIKTLVSSVDRDKILTMGNTLKTEFNIVFNHTRPYTEETLSAKLGLHIKKFRMLINKLVKHSILSYTVCAPSGYIQKVYMLNPTLVRKRKTFNRELLHLFKDFSKSI